MAISRTFHVCFIHIKMMLINPAFYMFICIAFCYFHQLNDGCVRFQLETGMQINSLGYTVGVFSNHTSTLVFGLGCVAVFSGLPLIRENALFECTRCTRNTWIAGRILYVGVISISYSTVMMLFCLLTCNGSLTLSASWGKVLNSIANGITFGDAELPVEICLPCIEEFAPHEAFLITLALNIGASAFIGILILFLTLVSTKTIALLCASLLSFMDFVIYEKLPYWVYRFSPLSYTRMSIVTNIYMPHYPTLSEAAISLLFLIVIVSVLSVIAVRKSKLFSSKILFEQY